MEETALYPLKFTPYLKRVIWGGHRLAAFKGMAAECESMGESWEISALPGFETRVANGPLKGATIPELIERYGSSLVGDISLKAYGERFPLLFKFLDVKKDLSVQVHPDEATARSLSGGYGKSEFCYVVEAEPEAVFYNGFNRDIDHTEIKNLLNGGFILDSLQAFRSAPGDAHYVPARRVHAVGAGHLIAEIQQSSDITYRIYDYDRTDVDGKKRELHTEQAAAALDLSVPSESRIAYDGSQSQVTFEVCPWFTCSLINVVGKASLPLHTGSFIVLMAIEGRMDIMWGDSTIGLDAGETVLIPACLQDIAVGGKGKTLATYLPENLP